MLCASESSDTITFGHTASRSSCFVTRRPALSARYVRRRNALGRRWISCLPARRQPRVRSSTKRSNRRSLLWASGCIGGRHEAVVAIDEHKPKKNISSLPHQDPASPPPYHCLYPTPPSPLPTLPNPTT